MRTLKEIRLVYRQHLLPPLIVPFEKFTDYRKVIDNSHSRGHYNDQIIIMQEIN
jgi:hypothetical protein